MESFLGIVDYVFIVLSIIIASGIGLYYGVIKKRRDTAEEYFLAGRNLGTFIMSFNVFAAVASTGTLTGYPSEVYLFGTQHLLSLPFFFLTRSVNMFLFFPIFFKLGSPDINKYFEVKFHKNMRYLLTTLAIIHLIMLASLTVYGTATTLSNSSGINVWILLACITTICCINSTLGGARGISLASVIQGSITILSIGTILTIAIIHVGGFNVIWQRSKEGKRLELFNFDVNPTVRNSFWTAAFANLFNVITSMSLNPAVIMKLMVTKARNKSTRASFIGTAMIIVLLLMCGFLGLISYTTFYDCDPLTRGSISNANQIISAFINTLTEYYGVAGLFYSATIATSIGVTSSELNALSALVMETFLKPLKMFSTEKTYTLAAKFATIAMSFVVLVSTFIIQQFTNVYQARVVILALTTAPTFALFIIGLIFPQANNKSAIGSFIIGILFLLWVSLGNMLAKTVYETKPLSISGCTNALNSTNLFDIQSSLFNETITNVTIPSNTSINWKIYFPLSKVSFHWFNSLGILVMIFSFIILSIIFGADTGRRVDINLIPTFIQKIQKKFNRSWQKILLCDVYHECNADREMTMIQSQAMLENT